VVSDVIDWIKSAMAVTKRGRETEMPFANFLISQNAGSCG
jgi:hypothetical protein